MVVHMMKLVVGIDTLDDFADWQARERVPFEGGEANIVRTRYKPKQADDLLEDGGSIYRIIKGVMCCRQEIIGFDTFESDTGPRCLILTDTEIIRTNPRRQRAFQGWRYLKPDVIPADIGPYKSGEDISEMELELRALGLL